MYNINRIFVLAVFAYFLLMFPQRVNAQGTGTAPTRPECTEEVPCEFNEMNGLNGARVILFDPGVSHSTSKTFFRDALARLSNQYGFIVDRRGISINNLTEDDLDDAKIIIYSSTDGDLAANIPNVTVRGLVENFVQERGWGLLLVHAACSFVSYNSNDWPFLEDACIQQYFRHNNSGTQATLYLEDRTVDGEAHGRANPYTSFLFEDLPDRQEMRDEWFTWRGNPRTTHQFGEGRNALIENRIMLTALDEGTYSNTGPGYPDNHYVAWTHTMGNGIVLYNSYGHDNLWQVNDDDFGDELLGRYLRYLAKDWGPIDIAGTHIPPANGLKLIWGAGGTIEFTLPQSGWAEINLYSPGGKLAATVAQGKFDVGTHRVALDAGDLPGGLYLARLKAPGVSHAQKILLE